MAFLNKWKIRSMIILIFEFIIIHLSEIKISKKVNLIISPTQVNDHSIIKNLICWKKESSVFDSFLL